MPMKIIRPVLRWENPVNSGITIVVGNLVMIALYKIPLADLIFWWLPLVCIVTGGARKAQGIFTKQPIDYQNLPLWVPTKMVEVAVGKLNAGIGKCLPLIFWETPQTTLMALGVWYVASSVLAVMGLFTLSFLIFNGAFIYGKFEKQILIVVGPHLEKAKVQLNVLLAKIPHHTGALGKGGAAVAPASAHSIEAKSTDYSASTESTKEE